MMRRCAVHVLLSLLLLVSQQMAFAHALTHWTGQWSGHGSAQWSGQPPLLAADADRDLSTSVAQDRSCSQCLAFAQLGSLAGSTARAFAPLDPAGEPAAVPASGHARPRSACVFDSRAPPSFV
ncbi:MAG: hypothetical protein V7631_2739 [Massilia sp.]|jgi:hypothetical protein